MRLIQNLTISWEMNFYEIKELYEIEINNGKRYIKTRSSDYNGLGINSGTNVKIKNFKN
jgi:hypothetical protein